MKAKLVIIMAMEEEARPVIDFLQMRELNPLKASWNNQIYQSELDQEIFLITNGKWPVDTSVSRVGTQAAAISTFIAIEILGAKNILNAGTAGGFANAGARIGDVYLCERVFYHDRRVPINESWELYAKGNFFLHSPSLWYEKYGLKKASVSSGNSLDYVQKDLDLIHEFGCSVKEMEAAAIAELCTDAQVPCFVIKSITDIVDGPRSTPDEFVENLSMASSRLSTTLKTILEKEFLNEK